MKTPVSDLHQRVLIIDDDESLRLLIAAVLGRDAYDIHHATNGSEGIEQFASVRPRLILMDALMPKLDGFEASAAIRALPDGGQVPILMMTGLDDPTAVARGYACGVSDFIDKPFNRMILRQRVRRMMDAALVSEQLHTAEQRLKELRCTAKPADSDH